MASLNTYLALVAAAILPLVARGAPLTTASGSYSLTAEYSGPDFFDHFTTFTGPDPTHGEVDYVDMETALTNKLITYTNNTDGSPHAIIGADHTNVAPSGRNSVRLTSKQTFSVNTLSILDVRHIPVQWGVWPAIWFLGDLPGGTWPGTNGGESDWLEWVHKSPYNSMTLHTGPGCSVLNSSSSAPFQGTLLNTDCNAGAGSEGCSVAAYAGDSSSSSSSGPSHSNAPSAGDAFNSANGAIYAHHWTPEGVTVWMFPHDAVPPDLLTPSPDPSSWSAHTTPLARFGGPGCDFARALQELRLIINIDFCGDWAGAPTVWASSGAQRATGSATCAAFVQDNPQAFRDAYFEIASLKFYSLAAAAGGKANGATAVDQAGGGDQGSVVSLAPSGNAGISLNQTATNFAQPRSDSTLAAPQAPSVHPGVRHDERGMCSDSIDAGSSNSTLAERANLTARAGDDGGSIITLNPSGEPVVYSNRTGSDNFTLAGGRRARNFPRQTVNVQELEDAREKVTHLTTAIIVLSLVIGLSVFVGFAFLIRACRSSRREWS